MFCCTLLYPYSSFVIILMGKSEQESSWCLMNVEWLFLVVPWVCLQFVIVVFPDHTHLLFLMYLCTIKPLVRILCKHLMPIGISCPYQLGESIVVW